MPAPGSASTDAGTLQPVILVTRPGPGLARGLWEARPSTLYLMGLSVVLGAALYAVLRLRRAARPRKSP